jgi:hypothetical protein
MATTNFNFRTLLGSDKAGYNSINALITSIDNRIYERVTPPGTIIMYDTSGGSSAPPGWRDIGKGGPAPLIPDSTDLPEITAVDVTYLIKEV